MPFLKVEELLEKEDRISLQIIRKLLLAGGRLSAEVLPEMLGITAKSTQKYLAQLQTPQAHFRLRLQQQVIFEADADFSLEGYTYELIRGSLKYRLLDQLFRKSHWSIQALCIELSASESTVYRKIKELNRSLEEFELEIKQGMITGPELQIRYFYFQFYWFILPYEEHRRQQRVFAKTDLFPMIEKNLQLSFSEHERLRVNLWLKISKKRYRQGDQYPHGQMRPYLNDPLYLQLKRFFFRFLSRYSVSLDENEVKLQYIFLRALSVVTPADHARLFLQSEGPIEQLNQRMLAELQLFFQPQELPESERLKTSYYLSQAHSMLYFFKGDFEIFDEENIWQKEKSLSTRELAKHAHYMRQVATRMLGERQDSLVQLTEIKYLSCLSLIEVKMAQKIQGGLDLQMEPLFAEAYSEILKLSLQHLNGLVLTQYDPHQTYDLVLSNVSGAEKERYLLSEIGSEYDLSQIKKKIQQLVELRQHSVKKSADLEKGDRTFQ